MKQLFFPSDKNYILKEAQGVKKEELLCYLFRKAKANYLLLTNPLGLEDDTTLRIKDSQKFKLEITSQLYDYLAVIYRYKYGSNQLEFLFDEKSHWEKYEKEWTLVFYQWADEFCRNRVFLRLVIQSTLAFPLNMNPDQCQIKVRKMVSQHFKMRIDRRTGLPSRKAI
ncbi:hypothetical protein [Xanthovirga aplysinae]|uniref:hypothetical protein n=1 Tax=Xanthovirga aplysinae TaxID=2529853 RepID=UPI0012BC9735|nr:hypothetical protein [Xanthovirga aplysinae]MTI30978.1 hypothetical protein [Xanthovirga aplysinae]